MSQPPAYSRAFSFTNFQAANPSLTLPGSSVDLELNNAKATLDAVLRNLALIQRDDGAPANGTVGYDTLSPALQTGGIAPAFPWLTGVAYSFGASATHGTAFYRATVAHTSGVFTSDLAAGRWVLIVDFATITPSGAASTIAVTPSGLLTSDVQTSLQALDTGKAALSHSQAASTISDSTTAGRAMLTAATLAAQKALLGLGSLAFLNSTATSQIAANLAFINPILGSLITSINDWTPTGWATASVVRLTASSAINITGFAATTDGDIKIVYNIGSFVVTLPYESGSSAAANRITGPSLPLSFAIQPGNGVAFIYDATAARWRVLSPSIVSPVPTVQIFTSGSGTYTTPAKVAWIRVRRRAGGGGGGGGQNATPGSTGGSTTFQTLSTASGGVGGALASGGAGGAASGGNVGNIPGGSGAGGTPPGLNFNAFGGVGGGHGGAPSQGSATGSVGATNTGGGGGGGGATNGTLTGSGGGGGGEGGEIIDVINAPSSTYTYGVGAGGAGAVGSSSSSSSGGTGGAGAAGVIVVEEFY